METKLINKIKEKLKPLEEEYEKTLTKFNKKSLNEKELNRGADVEGWISELKNTLEYLEKGKKPTYIQSQRLDIIFQKIEGIYGIWDS